MTLRQWEVEGKLILERIALGHRHYDLAKFKPKKFHKAATAWRTIAYDLSRSIADMSFHEFWRQVEYKVNGCGGYESHLWKYSGY